jgi:hypothetical protein
LTGGYAVYQYNYNQALKRGMTKEEAEVYATNKFMDVTDSTQQSSSLKDMNEYQKSQGFFRFLTMFRSADIGSLNLTIQELNRLRFGDKKKAIKKLTNKYIINHLVVPPLMLAVNDLLRLAIEGDDWEFNWEDYIWGIFLGNWKSAFVVGDLIHNIGLLTTKKILGKKTYGFSNATSGLPLIDDIMRSSSTIIATAQKINEGEELSTADIFKIIDSTSNMLMGIGTIPKIGYLGELGGLLNATTRETKRFWRIFDEDFYEK